MIDAVYCVCLDKRKDLWSTLEKQVNDIIGLPLNKFIVGNGQDATLNYDLIDQPFSRDMFNYCKYGTPITIAAHANCFLSHKAILKQVKSKGYKNVLLLEDDAHIIADRWNLIMKDGWIYSFIKGDNRELTSWDLIYAGWWVQKTREDTGDQLLVEKAWRDTGEWAVKKVPTIPEVYNKICGFHGVIINESAYDRLIEAEYGPMDSWVGNHMDELKLFYTLPKVITAKSCFSYGENGFVERAELV